MKKVARNFEFFSKNYYIISEKKPRAWVISHVKPSDWWYGYYTEVYVANYSGKYNGDN